MEIKQVLASRLEHGNAKPQERAHTVSTASQSCFRVRASRCRFDSAYRSSLQRSWVKGSEVNANGVLICYKCILDVFFDIAFRGHLQCSTWTTNIQTDAVSFTLEISQSELSPSSEKRLTKSSARREKM